METDAEDLKPHPGDSEAPDVYDELKEARVTLKDFSELPPPPKEGLLPKYQAKPEKPVETRRSKKVAKHEKHPLLNMVAKLLIVTGALAGCTGQRETIQPAIPAEASATPRATTSETMRTPLPEANLTTRTQIERVPAPVFAPGELTPENKQLLVEITKIDEISKLKSISFVDKAVSSKGNEVQVFSIDGATPFASTEQIMHIMNGYEKLSNESKKFTTQLKIDPANTVDAEFTIQSRGTHNKFIFFGNKDFRPGQAMPKIFGRFPNVYGVTVDGESLGIDASTTLMANGTGLAPPTDLNIDFGNNVLGTEVCQSTLKVTITEDFRDVIRQNSPTNPQLTEERLEYSGQEVVCNSIGYASAAKATGYTYDQYVQSSKSLIDSFYAPLSVDGAALDQPTYEQLQ